jgi:hypothetical protein
MRRKSCLKPLPNLQNRNIINGHAVPILPNEVKRILWTKSCKNEAGSFREFELMLCRGMGKGRRITDFV